MRALVLLSAPLLALALGCGDGIGQPIVRSTSASSGGAGAAGSGGASSGMAGTLVAMGGTAGSAGGPSGAGGTAGRQFEFDPPWAEGAGRGGRGEPDWDPDEMGPGMGPDMGPSVPPGSHCESVSDWDEGWEGDERQLLYVLNGARGAAGTDAAQAQGVGCDGAESAPAQPLVMRPELRCAARLHSRDMSVNNYVNHVNQDDDGPEDRIRATGYYAFGVAGESIAAPDWPANPSEILFALFEAGGSDCKNLLDPRFEEVGIGRFENLWTLDFAGR